MTEEKSVQVQIVDPEEVSQLIELEDSKSAVPRRQPAPRPPSSAGPRTVPLPAITSPRDRGPREEASGFFEVGAENAGEATPATRRSASRSQDSLLLRRSTGAENTAQAMGGTVLNERLIARKLAVSVHATIENANATTVLLTSPANGAGKTKFARAIAPHLATIAPDRYAIYSTNDLADLDPSRRTEGLVVLVDGPAMLDGDGLLRVPQRWMDAFDGALLMVVGRQTRRDDLAESVQWLDRAGVPTLGVLFNEFANPAPMLRARRWLRYLTGGTVIGDLFYALRTGGKRREAR